MSNEELEKSACYVCKMSAFPCDLHNQDIDPLYKPGRGSIGLQEIWEDLLKQWNEANAK